MVVVLPTEKDLEDERRRRASVLSLLSLRVFSSIQVWMSDRQVSREDIADWWKDRDLELSIVRERLRLNRVTLNQVRKRFCVEDEENWAQHRTLWHTIGKAWGLWDVVIDDDWLCSICQIRKRPGEMPYMCWSLSRSMPWSIVSKAAERSKSVRRETLQESSARRMSFVILKRALSVL